MYLIPINYFMKWHSDIDNFNIAYLNMLELSTNTRDNFFDVGQ